MKKLITMAAMALFTITAAAQTIDGDWIIDGDFSEAFTAVTQTSEENGIELKIGLSFSDNVIKTMSWLKAGAEGISLAMNIFVPGTYTREGNNFTCTFDKEKADFEITDMKSNEPELKEALENPAMAKMVIGMIKQQAKPEFQPLIDTMSDSSDVFKSFTLKELTDTTLVILIDGKEVNLKRK